MGLLLLVRHGQASFGAADYDVLSDLGVAQGRRLGSALVADGVVPTAIVHGAMRRQRDTAGALIEAASWPVAPTVDDGWDEFDHLAVVAGAPDSAPGSAPMAPDGDRRAFRRLFEQATARWAAGEGEYDETFAAFVARARGALDRAAAGVGSGETVVVVTSGGVIAVVAALLTMDSERPGDVAGAWQRFNTVTVNTSVSRVLVGATGVRLLTFNEHGHLHRDEVSYR